MVSPVMSDGSGRHARCGVAILGQIGLLGGYQLINPRFVMPSHLVEISQWVGRHGSTSEYFFKLLYFVAMPATLNNYLIDER
jgi:hypothetical protein